MESPVTVASGFRPLEITVDRDSPTPLYHQVAAAIKEQIHDGRLAAGERIQQERDLAKTLGVSLAPVRQAILALVAEGYLARSRGRGTFVCEQKVDEQLSSLSSFSDLLRETGRPWSLSVLGASVVEADENVTAALGSLPAGMLHVRRLATLDGEPIALLNAYLDAGRFGALAGTDLSGSLYQRLSQDHGVEMVSARNLVGAAELTAPDSVVLGLPRRSMVLEVVAVTADQNDVPTEYSRVLYHPSRFRFQIDSHRRDDSVVRLIGPVED
ncbi:GntR family transcriptional regulator [Streptomyces sp. NPDC006638]|uniref:GntR family transcriptional regulator n=1 Tax=unclassified Streptomyces TaxID=2593676 RepID=UPI0033B268F4